MFFFRNKSTQLIFPKKGTFMISR